jgi:hypothetical protein
VHKCCGGNTREGEHEDRQTDILKQRERVAHHWLLPVWQGRCSTRSQRWLRICCDGVDKCDVCMYIDEYLTRRRPICAFTCRWVGGTLPPVGKAGMTGRQRIHVLRHCSRALAKASLRPNLCSVVERRDVAYISSVCLSHTHTLTHTSIHAHTHTHAHMHTYMHTHMYTYMHTHMYTYMHTHTHTFTHTHTKTHTKTHTQAHIHTVNVLTLNGHVVVDETLWA